MSNSAITGFGGGRVVQVVNATDSAYATGTTAMPYDDTIPQNTEGDEYMTLAITPISASNKLKIDVVFNGTTATTNRGPVVALFQDTTASALASASGTAFDNGMSGQINFTYYMTAGTTSETTFKVRAGSTDGCAVSFNGDGGARMLAGTMASSITITEIGPGTGTIASDGSSQQYAVKAWASISYSGGVPTLDDSYNVSGIVDDGVGLITVNWDTDFGSVNYAVVSTAEDVGSNALITGIVQSSKAVGSVQILIDDVSGTNTDPASISVIAIGD